MEEKEVFELQCMALRKDSKMYKDRIEAILQQMEEVAIERDQVENTCGGQKPRRGLFPPPRGPPVQQLAGLGWEGSCQSGF